MTTRLLTFGISAVFLPLIWLVLRLATPVPARDATWCLFVSPRSCSTSAGNALVISTAPSSGFDDAMHYLNWIPWTTAFVARAARVRATVPLWALFGLVVGFGAVTHMAASRGSCSSSSRSSAARP